MYKFYINGNHSTFGIDGKVGDADITNHFAKSYEPVFDEYNARDELDSILIKLNRKITNHSLINFDSVTPNVIEKAVHLLIAWKSDPVSVGTG